MPRSDRRPGVGRLASIWIKRFQRGPMDAVDHAEIIESVGITGNADRGGWRQITVLSEEAWEAAVAELPGAGPWVDPSARRANLLVSGIDLAASRDRTLQVGDVRIEVRGETVPCERLDEAREGLRQALRPQWRGGVFGVALDSGPVRVGDPVRWRGSRP